MNISAIKNSAPAVFSSSPSPKMSDRYSFVNTYEVLGAFENEGWMVNSVTQRGMGMYNTHEIRLRNGDMPKVGDDFLEAIIRNSHNGTTKFSVSAGIHRLVCKNGLTIPSSISEGFSIRHQNFDIGEVRRVTDEFAEKLPKIEVSIGKMKSKILTDEEMEKYVIKASELRWKSDSIPNVLPIEQILAPRRQEDVQNDMWTVFNRVQESFIRGNVGYRTKNGRNSKLKSLNDIVVTNKINTGLWELADSMC